MAWGEGSHAFGQLGPRIHARGLCGNYLHTIASWMKLVGVSRMGMEAELVVAEVAPLWEGPGASLNVVFS